MVCLYLATILIWRTVKVVVTLSSMEAYVTTLTTAVVIAIELGVTTITDPLCVF